MRTDFRPQLQKNNIPLILCGRNFKVCHGESDQYDQSGGLWNQENTDIANSIEWKLFISQKISKQPDVEVIMPVYNTPLEWVKRSINSSFNQTYSGNIKLIMIDDGSENNYYEQLKKIIESFGAKILLLRNNENIGISKSLNICLKHTTSQFIFRMDSDDAMILTRIEKQIDNFYNLSDNVAVMGTNLITSNNYKTNHPLIVTKENLLNHPSFWVINHPTVCFRGDIIRKLRYPETDKNIPEDIILWYHILHNGYQIVNIPDITLFYQEHSQGNSHKLLTLNKEQLIEYYNKLQLSFY